MNLLQRRRGLPMGDAWDPMGVYDLENLDRGSPRAINVCESMVEPWTPVEAPMVSRGLPQMSIGLSWTRMDLS